MAAPTITLGDRVFNDLNSNGVYDAGEGVASVALTLFDDANKNNVADAGEQVATTTTGAGGLYTFVVGSGDYIVRVDSSNFDGGGALASLPHSLAGAPDPDNNVDNDDNGSRVLGQPAYSLAITLTPNGEPSGGGAINNALDFGFKANTAPTANAASVTGAGDGARIAVTLSGTDAETSVTSFTIASIAANATIYDAAAGGSVLGAGSTVTATANAATVYVQAAANFNGATSFTYTASDAITSSTAATVSITVTEVNDAPTATADALSSVAEDSGARTIAFTALTANDSAGPTNENGQTLTVTGVSNAVGGTVQIVGTDVIFTPTANFNGTASFDYAVTDNGTTNGGADAKTASSSVSFNIAAPEPDPEPAPPPAFPVFGSDTLAGADGSDSYAGGIGDDSISGAGGADSLDGDDGNDTVVGGSGGDFIRGLADNDSVDGGDGDDTVNGNAGQDSVQGGAGADRVYGGQGNDTVDGGLGDDPYVNGNKGDDLVRGGDGSDTCYGGEGSDTVYGDAGTDLLSGDLGNDILFGGGGADRFAIALGGGQDWIGDFNAADGDRIQLAPGQTYSISTYLGQTIITLGDGTSIGLAGVAGFSADWIVFG